MDDWVLDSLVGFLKSPSWSHAVGSFTDKNCVVFDAGGENKFSYTDIHREYQKLVEGLLEEFMADLGISGDQFTHACSLLQISKTGQENEELFEQVLAADDFLLFKANMVRRNIDLELQALTLLGKQMGHSPQAYDKDSLTGTTGDNNDRSKKRSEEEEKLLEEAVKLSKAQYQLEHSMDEEELQRMIELAKRESLELYQQQQQQQLDKEHQVASGTRLRDEGRRGAGKEREMADEDPMGEGRELESPPKPRDRGKDAKSHMERGEGKGEQKLIDSKIAHLPATADSQKVAHKTERESPPPTDSLPAAHKTQSQSRGREESAQSEMVGRQDGGAESEEDAMAKWLEVAKASLSRDPTSSAHSPPPHTCHHTAGPTPEQLRARELYLKRQRDHLLEARRQQKNRPCPVGVASSSPRQEASGVKRSSVVGEGGGGRGKRRGRDTGILSSAIAGNLKKV